MIRKFVFVALAAAVLSSCGKGSDSSTQLPSTNSSTSSASTVSISPADQTTAESLVLTANGLDTYLGSLVGDLPDMGKQTATQLAHHEGYSARAQACQGQPVRSVGAYGDGFRSTAGDIAITSAVTVFPTVDSAKADLNGTKNAKIFTCVADVAADEIGDTLNSEGKTKAQVSFLNDVSLKPSESAFRFSAVIKSSNQSVSYFVDELSVRANC